MGRRNLDVSFTVLPGTIRMTNLCHVLQSGPIGILAAAQGEFALPEHSDHQNQKERHDQESCLSFWYARLDSNQRPSESEYDALSS